jgi:pyrroloquinoline quinone biosynthesis protein B
MQSSIAVSRDGQHWFLINASPDIRAQLGAFPPLHPLPAPLRNSPLEAVLLTNADLDHIAGILFLREGGPLHLHASPATQKTLSDDLAFTPLLETFCGVVWHALPVDQWATLSLRDGSPSGLAYQALPLRSPPPIFGSSSSDEEQTVAFLIRDEQTRGVLLAAPDVFEITSSLTKALQGADAILFDGTFWSEEELGEVKATARKSSAMGHIPIRSGSLDILASSPARHRIYLHINNTNPIFQPDSPERKTVEKAGIIVGTDGMEFEL